MTNAFSTSTYMSLSCNFSFYLCCCDWLHYCFWILNWLYILWVNSTNTWDIIFLHIIGLNLQYFYSWPCRKMLSEKLIHRNFVTVWSQSAHTQCHMDPMLQSSLILWDHNHIWHLSLTQLPLFGAWMHFWGFFICIHDKCWSTLCFLQGSV
jgi:hypothetical protein